MADFMALPNRGGIHCKKNNRFLGTPPGRTMILNILIQLDKVSEWCVEVERKFYG